MRSAWLVLVLFVGCGGDSASSSDAAADAMLPAPQCLTATACASSAQDCSAGQRCNTALEPPQCETIYCGANGTACADDQLDPQNLCQSHYCSPAGVCADVPPDLGDADLASLVGGDMSACEPKGGSCTRAYQCCSHNCTNSACCDDLNTACTSTTQCCTGEYCNRGVCSQIRCVEQGAKCITSAECCTGSCTVNGTCGACGTKTQSCSRDDQCCSNTCELALHACN